MALTDKLSAIGAAIREKTGKSALLTLDQMPSEIASISGEGGTTIVGQSIYTGQVISNSTISFRNFADGSNISDHTKITAIFGVIEGNNTVIYKFRLGYGDPAPLFKLAESTQPAKNINVNVFDPTNGTTCDWTSRYTTATVGSTQITFAFKDGRIMSPIVIPMIMFEE